MVKLRVLGSTELKAPDGSRIDGVLTRPKRLALLSYLALQRPGAFCRREKLVGLFWSDSEENKARAILSVTLHHLRRLIGKDVVVTRGTEEIGVDADMLWVDTRALLIASDVQDLEAVAGLYRGPLLDGFHLQGGAGFNRWVELQRRRLHLLGLEACACLAEAALQSDPAEAQEWARKATALDPHDERAHSCLIRALAQAGHQAMALRAFVDFQERLRHDLEMEPSRDLKALADNLAANEEPRRRSSESGTVSGRGREDHRAVKQNRATLVSLDGHALSVESATVYAKASAAGHLEPLHPDGQVGKLSGQGAESRRALASVFEQLDPELRDAWLTVARFEPEPISTSLLEASRIDERKWQGLRALGIVEADHDRVRMHRLASEIGRRMGTDGEREAADKAYATGLLERADRIDWHMGLSVYLDDRPHYDVAVAIRPRAMSFPKWSELLYRVAFAKNGLRMFGEARGHLERSLALGLEYMDPQNPYLGLVRAELGAARFYLGDLSSVRRGTHEALQLDLSLLGPEHPNIGLHLDCLASVHSHRQQFREAETLRRRALEIERSALGADHPRVLRTRSNLAVDLRRQGKYEQARQHLERVTDDAARLLGEDAPFHGAALAILSSVHRRAGEAVRARDLGRRVLDGSTRLPDGSLFRHMQEELCGWVASD